MRIGILTGGGDVPGLNACIKAVVDRVVDDGHEVIGIRRGWAGLIDLDLDDVEGTAPRCVQELDRELVRTIDRTGGTFLHTSRTHPQRVSSAEVPSFLRRRLLGDGPYDVSDHVLATLDHLDLDVLIVIGGNETLSFALWLHEAGLPVVAVPKTMDNDVLGTEYCLGFSTAVTRAVGFIHQLRTSTGSHERIGVVELFGQASGETSLISAYLASVDRTLIPEVPFDPDHLAALLMEDKRRSPSRYAMVTVSEGARVHGQAAAPGTVEVDAHRGHDGIGVTTGRLITELTGEDVITQQLGYLLRSGQPDSLDLMVATNLAVMAADLAMRGARGSMVALRGGAYADVPLSVTGDGPRLVDVEALYDADGYLPKVRDVAGKPMFLY